MPARSPAEVDELFGEGINAGDVEAVVALYEPDAVLVAVPGQPAQGTEAIRAGIAGFVAGKPQIEMNVVSVTQAGNDLAVLYNDWVSTAKDPSGADVKMTGKAIEVVRKQPDGTWLFAIDDPWARGT